MPITSPFLCFLTDSNLHQNFCLRYWGISDGVWSEKFEVMLEESGIGKWEMLGIVKSSCHAYLLHCRCKECGTPAQVQNRSCYSPLSSRLTRSSRYRPGYRCRSCAAAALARDQRATEVAAELRHVRETEFPLNTREDLSPIDYSTIGYVQTFFLYCALIAANTGWGGKRIAPPDSHPGELAPTLDLSARVYRTLYEEKIIAPDRASDADALCMIDDGPVDFAFGAVSWVLAPDASGRTMSDVFSLLLTRLNEPEPKAVERLWFIVAESECRRYFLKQCERYRFIKSDVYSAKVAEVIRDYLPRFSIGQMWNVIYYVLKDLAALSQERTYARQHVYNMIPGQMRRYFDYRIANSKHIHPWRRPAPITESWMSSILLDKVLGNGNKSFEVLTGQSVRSCVEFRADECSQKPRAASLE
jgi:hypothetical protein